MTAALLLAGALAQPAAAAAPITGARLDVIEKRTPLLEVTIENRRGASLVEWIVTAGTISSSGRETVAPGARRVIALTSGERTPAETPRLALALYADGSYEGSGPQFDSWLKARRRHADDLAYWLNALTLAPQTSMVALRRRLDDQLAERSVTQPLDAEPVSDRVRDTLRHHPDGDGLRESLARLENDIKVELQNLTRSDAALPAGGAGTSIVASRDTTVTTYAVVVENLRDVPIEAFHFEELDPDGTSQRGQGEDFCLSDPADRTPGRGRIQPHERREIPVHPQPYQQPPRYTLSFVLFDDLSFEGRAEARDDTLRRRAAMAYEWAFAVDAMTAAAAIPANSVEAFLEGRRIDWARRLGRDGQAIPSAILLDESLRQARRSPERFLAGLPFYRGVLEGQLTRLRRHLPPGGIAGARLTVVDKSSHTLTVTIENERDSPLIEWWIDSPWMGFGRRDVVAPHGRQTVSIDAPVAPPSPRPAIVVFAAFEDGYYEGRGRPLEQWLAARDERREDLAYWTKVFAAVPHTSEADMRRFLADRVAERASSETHMTQRHVSDRVQDLMLRFPSGPYLWEPLDALQKDVMADYAAVTRVPANGAPSGAVDTVTAATVISSDVHPTQSYAVMIENLRDVPIEAYGIQDFDLTTGHAKGGSSLDFCATDPARSSARGGRIMPHETRDLGQAFGPGPVVPLAKMWFVMFGDLQFEGDPAERATLLNRREALAKEDAIVLDVLTQAATVPAAGIEAFLVQQREAYMKRLERDGRMPPPGGAFEEYLGRLRRTSAERFVHDIPAMRESLEAAIVRLTRHVPTAPR